MCRGAPAESATAQYDSRVSGISRGQAPDREATLLVESRRPGNIVLALIVAACAVALFNVVKYAQTATGRVVGAVVFGAVLVLMIVGWIRMNRRPRRRLEIAEDASGTWSRAAACLPCRASREMSLPSSYSTAEGESRCLS